MRTYLLGPLLALLPKGWRASLRGTESIQWRRAAFVSGLLQACLALCGLVYWYSYSVTHWARDEVFLGLRAHPNVHVHEPGILGLTALVFVGLNPITWFICWIGLEGMVRLLGAAITGEIVGSLPFWAIDWCCCAARRWTNPAGAPPAADQVKWDKVGEEEILVVTSSRPKPNWQNHPAIRYQGELFKVTDVTPSRHFFVYQLRRLQPGEIPRGLEDYDPAFASSSQR